MVLLKTPELYPLNVGLAILKPQNGTFYNVVLEVTMFNTIPMVLLFLVFSRFYVQGATYSGVKG
jgi:ABC-type glycerol-3-phosphate transport system permease component